MPLESVQSKEGLLERLDHPSTGSVVKLEDRNAL